MRTWTRGLAPTLILLSAARACPQVVINEVLPAPGTDWTDNGIYSPQEDEWVELLNLGPGSADLSSYFLSDAAGAASPRIGLEGLLAPGEYLFVTGEHSLDWEFLNGFPAVGLSLNNSGDLLQLFQVSGGTTTLVDSLSWGAGEPAADVSLGHLPDGTGPWTLFDALTPGGGGVQPTPGAPNGGIASPKILSMEVTPPFPASTDTIRVRALCADSDGIAECLLLLALDGGPLSTVPMALAEGLPEYGTWELGVGPYAGGTQVSLAVRVSDGSLLAQTNDTTLVVSSGDSPLVLNEILADPAPALAGDANGDGIRDTADDEFVEIYNRGSASVDLTGWALRDAIGLRHEFSPGLLLAPGELFVVFGGGEPTGIPCGVEVASSGSLSLNNAGDEVRLVGPDGVARDVHLYGSEANGDESLIRVPDGHGTWTRPSDVGYGWLFSPGVLNGPTTGLSEVSWGQIKSLYRR